MDRHTLIDEWTDRPTDRWLDGQQTHIFLWVYNSTDSEQSHMKNNSRTSIEDADHAYHI